MKKVKFLTALMLILATVATLAGSVLADDVAGTNYENQYYSIKSADGFTKYESGKNCSWTRSDGVFYVVSVESNEKSINARNLSDSDMKNYENSIMDKITSRFSSGSGNTTVNIDSVNAKKTTLNDCGAVRIEIVYTVTASGKSMSANIGGYLITTKNYIYFVLYQYQSGKEAAKPMLEDVVSSINVKDEKFSRFSFLKMGKLSTIQLTFFIAIVLAAIVSVVSLIQNSRARKYRASRTVAESSVFNAPPMENSMSSPLPPNMNYPSAPAAPMHPGSPNYPTNTQQPTASVHPSSRPQPKPPASYGNPENVDVSLYQGDPMYSVIPNRPQNSEDPDYAENVAKQSPHNATISAESKGYRGERINNNAPIHPLNASYPAGQIESNANPIDNSLLSQPQKPNLPKESLPNITDLEKK